MQIATLTITHEIDDDTGEDAVVVEAEDNAGGVPPLVSMLGMLELGKECVYALAWGEREDEEDDDDE